MPFSCENLVSEIIRWKYTLTFRYASDICVGRRAPPWPKGFTSADRGGTKAPRLIESWYDGSLVRVQLGVPNPNDLLFYGTCR